MKKFREIQDSRKLKKKLNLLLGTYASFFLCWGGGGGNKN